MLESEQARCLRKTQYPSWEIVSHLERISVKLTRLSKNQVDYLGVPVEGPCKPEHDRY